MRVSLTKHSGRCRSWSLLWPTMVGFLCLIALCTVTNIDLWLSARFYDAIGSRAWFLKNGAPWSWLYRYGQYPGILMAAGAALILVGSFVRQAWARYRRHCLVLVLAVALGPGLVVNGIVKPLWGRPRPRQIEQFGGSQSFRPWWQPGGPGTGKSFPSGHASMGYVLVAGAFLISKRRLRVLIFTGGLGYGTLLGLTRIIQGAHFASDVVWSGVLVYGVIIGLQEALRVFPDEICQ